MTAANKDLNRSKPYSLQKGDSLQFITWTIVDWVDIFSRKIYRDIAMDSLRFCIQNKGLELYAYVIMSNHIHLIAAAGGSFSLGEITASFKKHTAKAFLKTIKEEPESRHSWMLHVFEHHGRLNTSNALYQVWQNDSHAVVLESTEWILQKLDYIHQNPVRNNIVKAPEQYLYSSAGAYAGYEEELPLHYLI